MRLIEDLIPSYINSLNGTWDRAQCANFSFFVIEKSVYNLILLQYKIIREDNDSFPTIII